MLKRGRAERRGGFRGERTHRGGDARRRTESAPPFPFTHSLNQTPGREEDGPGGVVSGQKRVEHEVSSDGAGRPRRHGRQLGVPHGSWSSRRCRTRLRLSPDVCFRLLLTDLQSSLSALTEEGAAGRRRWVDTPPKSLLDALGQAELTSSTLDSPAAGQNPDRTCRLSPAAPVKQKV